MYASVGRELRRREAERGRGRVGRRGGDGEGDGEGIVGVSEGVGWEE